MSKTDFLLTCLCLISSTVVSSEREREREREEREERERERESNNCLLVVAATHGRLCEQGGPGSNYNASSSSSCSSPFPPPPTWHSPSPPCSRPHWINWRPFKEAEEDENEAEAFRAAHKDTLWGWTHLRREGRRMKEFKSVSLESYVQEEKSFLSLFPLSLSLSLCLIWMIVSSGWC